MALMRDIPAEGYIEFCYNGEYEEGVQNGYGQTCYTPNDYNEHNDHKATA